MRKLFRRTSGELQNIATPAGAARTETLWRSSGRPEQRTFSGAVKPAEIGHDVAVYRAERGSGADRGAGASCASASTRS